MFERWDRPEQMHIDHEDGEDNLKRKEVFLIRLILFRAIPVLMIVLSISSCFFGWIRIPDKLREDLNSIQKYVKMGNNFLNKYLGTSELAGINTEEIGELIDVFSDGELTPYEIFSKGETVQNASDSVSRICTKIKLESDMAGALETLAKNIQLFRYLFFAVIGTGLLTILMILFRKKLFGNWYFTIAMALMAGWCWQLVRTVNEKMAEGGDIKCTMLPVIALLFSLPLIPYGRKKQ